MASAEAGHPRKASIDLYMANYQAITKRENFKRISREELSELVVKAQNGDSKSRDLVIAQTFMYALQRVIKTRDLKRFKMEDDDILQYAMIGVLNAIERYDVETGFSFLTYATWWIKQGIDRGMMNDSNNVKMPVHIYQKHRDLIKAYKLLKETKPDLPQLRYMGVKEINAIVPHETEETIRSIVNCFFCGTEVSLDQEMMSSRSSDEDKNGYEIYGSQEGLSVDEAETLTDVLHNEALAEILKTALLKISAKERFILIRRFGLFDSNEQTLEEIGAIMGVTRERIRQLEATGLRKLKGLLHHANNGQLPSVSQVEDRSNIISKARARPNLLKLKRSVLSDIELEIMHDIEIIEELDDETSTDIACERHNVDTCSAQREETILCQS